MSDSDSDDSEGTGRLRRFGLASDVLEGLQGSGVVAPEGPSEFEAFARQVGSTSDSGDENNGAEERSETWITSRLGTEIYGLPVTHISEIARVVPITRVPGAPAGVKGIANIRGRVLTVLDLKERLGIGSVGEGAEARILVAPWRSLLFGLLVECVDRVVQIRPSEVQRRSETQAAPSNWVQGVISNGDMFVILLDPEEILAGGAQCPSASNERRSA